MIEIHSSRLRRLMRILLPSVLIPATVAAGVFIFDEKKYAFISLALVIWAFLLFAAGFERKKTGSRRLVIITCMVALSVAGRFLPLFKPVTALTVLTGMYLGGEAGFLTGALSAVISNFSFGQGPWTPFQMCAWGAIGLCAGLLNKALKRNRVTTALFGLFSGLIFSLVMDVWTVVWYNGAFHFSLYLSALASAAPFTVLYCISDAVFLYVFARPFGEKLERVKLKYGV